METTALTGAAAGLLVVGAALVGAWRARGTTAVPACWWAVAAGVALALERVTATGDDPAAAACRRLALVALGVCPGLSLLGAKRPQHLVWQAIVGSAAVVIALPAVTAALVRPGTVPDVPLVLRALVAGLILVGWLNHLATRRGIAATGIATGQFLLALPCLAGFGDHGMSGQRDTVAALLLGSAAVAAAVWPARRGLQPLDAAWSAFRETFGAAWALRVAERVDTVARERGWSQRIGWRGWEIADTGDVADDGDSRRLFVALLRRFVRSDWLARHGLPPRDRCGSPSAEDAADAESTPVRSPAGPGGGTLRRESRG